jgi:DNA-binding transcriptional regulator LsrR (DeoR family)
MSQSPRQKPKQSKSEKIEKLIRLLNAGKTQSAAATALGIDVRTVQRWLTDPAVKERLVSIRQEASAIAQTDPVVLSVADVRAQVQEILDYRNSQRSFALEMGTVVQKATAVLLKAVEKLEDNPDEMSARTIPQLLRAVVDAADKVSNAWSRTTGLDDILEQINEPKVISQGSQDT